MNGFNAYLEKVHISHLTYKFPRMSNLESFKASISAGYNFKEALPSWQMVGVPHKLGLGCGTDQRDKNSNPYEPKSTSSEWKCNFNHLN